MQPDGDAEDSAVRRRVCDMTLEDANTGPPLNKRVRSSSSPQTDALRVVGVGGNSSAVPRTRGISIHNNEVNNIAAANIDNMDMAGHNMVMVENNGGNNNSSSIRDDTDAGSSSCKDVEDPGVLAPDSVPAMVAEIRKLLDYVSSKPTLQCGSASFMRDYLRTLLITSSVAADEAIAEAARAAKETDRMTGISSTSDALALVSSHMSAMSSPHYTAFFRAMPDELAKHIFSFLDDKHLAVAREVCRKWNEFGCEEHLWKALCIKRWRSLDTDAELWKLIDKNVPIDSPTRWRSIYPTISSRAQWPCRLQKTGRFICNLVAHHISGAPLGPSGLPKILVVERRFNILHLQTFVLPDASVLYFEPEQESDRAGFADFIEYLTKRTRAGLALEDERRFIFIPPCDYTNTHVGYGGQSLLGVVQHAYPPA
jgi:hypothetical protein